MSENAQALYQLLILHTSDVHLDRAFSGLGMTAGIAAARREELRDGFRRFINLAIELNVDAVTIGGDLYEHDRVTPDTANFLRRQFARLGSTPVLIAPGNHDPVVADSLWRRVAWPSNVSIFTEPRMRSVGLPAGVTVWGVGHDRPDLRTNLLTDFRVPVDGRHILLFHGSDLHSVPEGKDAHCGFQPGDIARTGADFALLGHYHRARLYPDDLPLFGYPGSPEALDFAESGEHFVLKLEIDSGGVRPELMPFGRVAYVTHRLSVDGLTSSDEVRGAIAQLGDAEAITRVVLEGQLHADVDLDIPSLYNATAEQFRFLQILDQTQPAWALEELAEESTTKGAFVRLIQERMAKSVGDDAEIAALALELGLQAFDRREVRVP